MGMSYLVSVLGFQLFTLINVSVGINLNSVSTFKDKNFFHMLQMSCYLSEHFTNVI
jgi:hypothetical protein